MTLRTQQNKHQLETDICIFIFYQNIFPAPSFLYFIIKHVAPENGIVRVYPIQLHLPDWSGNVLRFPESSWGFMPGTADAGHSARHGMSQHPPSKWAWMNHRDTLTQLQWRQTQPSLKLPHDSLADLSSICYLLTETILTFMRGLVWFFPLGATWTNISSPQIGH